MASGPLDGVRVVELAIWVAGPGAGGILADWGADVVKVEAFAGDPARAFGKMLGGDLDDNPVFELDNRGKRSAVLDLSRPEGVELVLQLIADADVFVTNIRASALERLGLDPDTLTGRFERLVYAIITGYGLEGAEADRAAYDVAAFWARSGMAESLRTPGGALPFQRGGMGDHSVAMTGAAMVSAALFERERTGRGQLVSTSLLRQGAYTIGFDVNVALLWGRTVAAGDRETMRNPTVNNYEAGDGAPFWLVGLEGERHWPALARAVDRPEWLTDERFATVRARAKNARVLIGELDAVFATRTRAEWAERFDAEPELFWAPVNTIDDLIGDAQFFASGAVVEVADELGSRSMLASPADFGGVTPRPRWRAPRLGEHTEDVLAELGLGATEIIRLAEDGVVALDPSREEA
jgi:crotonobetainyl-CoA:carnitine CoA-transferase CaiB-like acyl-CoA transferase